MSNNVEKHCQFLEAILPLAFVAIFTITLTLICYYKPDGNNLKFAVERQIVSHSLFDFSQKNNKDLKKVITDLENNPGKLQKDFFVVRKGQVWFFSDRFLLVGLVPLLVVFIFSIIKFGFRCYLFGCAFILMLLIIGNYFTVNFFHFALPLFDLSYVCFLALVYAILIGLSHQLFKKWKLHLKSDLLTDQVATRGNLISLISHNLNTPVAKMQGLYDILCKNINGDEKNAPLLEVKREISKLHLSIKSVLTISKIEDNMLNDEPISLLTFKAEFEQYATLIFKKFGIEVVFDIKGHPDQMHMTPFCIDLKVMLHVLTVICMLFRSNNRFHIQIAASLTENDDHRADNYYRLTFILSTTDGFISDTLRSLLKERVPKIKRSCYEEYFFEALIVDLSHRMANNYFGLFKHLLSDKGEVLKLELYPRSLTVNREDISP